MRLNRRIAVHGIVVIALIAGAHASAVAQQDEAPAVEPQPASEPPVPRELLDTIRHDMVELRFEKALAGIEALLGNPGMNEDERAEVLVLRGQTHVAFGDLSAAEQDYREILALRPGYAPDSSLTPKKAMERYERVQRQLVGRLALTLDPADASLLLDGRPLTSWSPSAAALPLLAGTHRVVARRAGYDDEQRTVEVVADQESTLDLQLMPNSRTVVIRSVPDDVEVTLDGVVVGRTVRPRGAFGDYGASELTLEHVSLGEHEFELRKPCFRTARMRDDLTVDLLDRSPKHYTTVTLDAASARLDLRGAPSGAAVTVDGAAVGSLPLGPVLVCPGDREVEARFAGRRIWISQHQVEDGETGLVQISGRPNVALAASDGVLPRSDAWNDVGRIAVPRSFDPARLEHWGRLDLPADVDIVFAPGVRGNDVGDRWVSYSPILDTVETFEGSPADLIRPAWSRAHWGIHVVDSRLSGAGVVVQLDRESAAAHAGMRVGDRVLSVGGWEISSAADVRSALRAASGEQPLEVRWRERGGAERTAELRARIGPVLVDPRVDDGPGPWGPRAAWARVDGLTGGEVSATAKANLALMLSSVGRHDSAVGVWSSVSWGARSGLGEGTIQYYLGRELQSQGEEEAAAEAFRRAAETKNRAFHDCGPAVGPAARDHLADLGVSPD
ncbi:MAG: PDZ domain-containing protein [bacterium]|nr:PDZ domain-containing protein [bacterium]